MLASALAPSSTGRIKGLFGRGCERHFEIRKYSGNLFLWVSELGSWGLSSSTGCGDERTKGNRKRRTKSQQEGSKMADRANVNVYDRAVPGKHADAIIAENQPC